MSILDELNTMKEIFENIESLNNMNLFPKDFIQESSNGAYEISKTHKRTFLDAFHDKLMFQLMIKHIYKEVERRLNYNIKFCCDKSQHETLFDVIIGFLLITDNN